MGGKERNRLSKHISLIDRLQEQASKQPQKKAFTFLADGETEIDSFTYKQLNEKAKAIATVLQTNNAEGKRALLLYQPGLEFITAFLGCLYAGVVAVPVYPPRANRSLERLLAIVTDAQAEFALTAISIQNQVASKFASNQATENIKFIATDTLELNALDWQHPKLTADSLAFLQYTSGSTGTPKGVMVSHGNLIANSISINRCFQNTREHTAVSWLPPYHDMGLIGCIIQPMYVGLSMYLMAPVTFLQRPYHWLQAISRYRGNTNGGPNFAFDLCVDRISPEQKETLDLSCWELAFSGAEPVRAETIDRFSEYFRSCGFRREAFYPCYGMAESTLMITGGDKQVEPIVHSFDRQELEENRAIASSDEANERTLVGCGQNIPGQTIVIVNPETLAKCQDQQIGEIWTKSNSVAQGYWNRPEQTAASFNACLTDTQECGWLRTGDLGFLQAGELFVTGRLKDLIIIRGRNYYPQDIELTLDNAHEAIFAGNTAAFAVEIGGKEQLVVTPEIKRTHLRKLNVEEVTKAIRQALAQNHELQPYAIVLLKTGSIPKTSSGKIKRHACRADFLAGSLNVVGEYINPSLATRRGVSRNAPTMSGNPQKLKASPPTAAVSRNALTMSGNSQKLTIYPARGQRPPLRGTSPHTAIISRMPHTYSSEGSNGETVALEGSADISKLSHPKGKLSHPKGRSPLLSSLSNKQPENIQNWLIENLAQSLGVSRSQIDINEPFASSGLDSVAAIKLSADLEDWLEIKLSPTLVYDYPNISELAAYLGSTQSPEPTATLPTPAKLNNSQADIAIIGIGCRFPGAKNPTEFWQLLRDGKDAITNLGDRWKGSNWGGFIDDVDKFDPQFFGITPRETQRMDPQQRLLLEVSWSALENAAIANEHLAGSKTGVFVGMSSSDYSQLQLHYGTDIDAYAGTGNAHSIAANRLSYLLDLRGPSLAIDTACSSSLVAVHLASQSLKTGECDQAIAGGVNLMLSPELTQTFSLAGMMAQDGKCKTFDADADGYVRGEGCGVVILKRLADAQRDNDQILAVIKGTAINQDGRSNGLTAPNGLAQQAVIRQALANANVAPEAISYIESHGTGTSLGDPIEVNSLKAVLAQDREPEQTCYLGSLKTNIGHLEAAAGIAGLIKTVLCLQQEAIPPNLHFNKLNPLIDLENTAIAIPTQLQPWKSADNPRLAGVSSFGFGGTNAHIVLQNSELPVPNSEFQDRPLHLLTLSAKSEPALNDLVLQYKDYLDANPEVTLADICSTANTGRTHFNHRLAIAVESKSQLQERLANFTTEDIKTGIVQSQITKNNPNKIAFLFTGQGSQYVKMGYQLYQTQPVFRRAINQCTEILNPYLDPPLIEILYPEDIETTSALLDETAYTQPAIFALEYALAQMWLSWGIKPEALIGHSVGEYVAATLAGIFSLEDGLKLVATRGKLMQALSHEGEMFAVFATETTVNGVIATFKNLKDRVAIAAINSLQSTVISGEKTAVQAVINKLNSQGIRSKQLNVSHAFHSPLMKPILQDFAAIAEQVNYSAPQIKLISNVTGKIATAEIATASYWVNHITAPVKFAQGMKSLEAENCHIFLEVGSKAILLGMGRSALSTESKNESRNESKNESRKIDSPALAWLPSLRPRKEDWQQILQSLAYLYSRGIAIDWYGFEQGYVRQKLALPTYPFQRQSYWLEKKSKSSSEEVELFLPTEKHSDLQKADFYQIEWQLKKPEFRKASITSNHHKTWVIFSDSKGLGKQIAEQLEKQNQTCLLISNTLENKLSDLEAIFKQDQDIQSVIYLWGLDNPENLNFAAINNYQQLNCTAILNLVQTLFKQSINAPIWLVTRGNQAVDNDLSESSVASSSLWGLGNAIALEHPEYWGGIIDLASDDLVSDKENNEANHLISLITNKNKEDRFALRQDEVYVPRLLKTERIESKNQALEFAPQSFYLITGGLGALGLKIAQWLAEKGAKHLVLTGRSKPDELADKAISKLEASGVTIKVIQADISNSDDVARIINIDSSLQLKGIIHAAGILDDGLLQSQTWSRFAKVISPKVIGAWNLHQLTKDIPLDFFVMFSSVASLIGSPGQSNYSVANAGLDAIALYRQSQNLPALSINWGPWADTGMAVKQGFSIKGFDLINPQMGLAAFEELLTSKLSQVGVIKADWQQLSQKFPSVQQSNFFSQLLTNLPKNKQIKSKNKILNELLATSGTDRKAYLTDYLQNAIAEILQVDPAYLSITDSLLDIGMDSLMVMEAINQLKTDLQLILYPREFYEHPQISSLAGYLATEFGKTHQPSTRRGERPFAPTQLPLPSHHSKLPPAAFILSSPRSGSTLLRVMLAGHPNLSSPPELHLLPFETMEEREQELGISHLGEGLKRAFMALKGINAPESQELVENIIKENLSITEVYQMLQQLAGDRLLIDKSPTYASNRETLERAENIFDNAKYIHLVRHPYAVIESFARMRMDKLITSDNRDPYQLAELIWKDSNQNILDFSNEIDPSRYHLVHYEDLVSQPRKVMTDICEFLDVPFNEAVLHPYQGDRMTDGLHESSMSLGDPNFRTHQQIDAQLAETWREIKLPVLLNTYAQQIANNLQYELPQEADADFGDLPMQETLLNIRGLRICLCTWGPEEGPVVLCLHGILEQGAAWSEVAIRLAQKGYRVIAPDLRGHGRSDRVGKGGSYNLIDFLGDIDAIVENLAGKAFILVGHSLGSVLGAVFATIRPQRIKNIVLVETILPTASEDEDEDTTTRLTNQLNYLASPPEHPVFPNVEAAAERLLKATPAIAKSLAILLAERITEPCEGGVRWRWEPLLRTRAGIGLNGIGRSRYLNLLKKITVPITLVYGDKSNFNRKEDLNKQQEAMPNAQRVVVSGGHNLPLEAPSALAKIISSAVALTTKLIP